MPANGMRRVGARMASALPFPDDATRAAARRADRRIRDLGEAATLRQEVGKAQRHRAGHIVAVK
jgi:hypothetical protein